MDSLRRSTLAKVVCALLFSIIFTTAVCSTVLIAMLSEEYGVFDKSKEAYKTELVEEIALAGEAVSIWNKDVHMDEENSINVNRNIERKHDGIDLEIRDNKGEILFSNVAKNEEYDFEYEQDFVYVDEIGCTISIYATKSAGGSIENISAFANWTYEHAVLILIFAMITAVLSIVLFVFLMYGAGRSKENDELKIRAIDRKFADIYGLAVLSLDAIIVVAIIRIYEIAVYGGIVAFVTGGIVMCLITLAWCMSVAVQIKSGTVLKNCILGYLIRGIGTLIKSVPYTWKKLLISLAILIFNLVIIANAGVYGETMAFLIVESIVIILAILYGEMNIRMLNNAADRLASGKIGEKLNVDRMFGRLKKHGEDLNLIEEAVAKAVNEQMKAERFKTELITNVSHDIKTPITSIINYSEILQRKIKDMNDDELNEYSDVIHRNAMRLKKMTTDIVEASKASTGAISVEISDVNLGMLVSQAIGEYEDKLKDAGLTAMVNIEEDINIKADGRHLWRMIDNILGNICKYSQADTRVYIGVYRDGNIAKAVFKNISKYELNITSDELMERFIRGDQSRNTDGSGLGLSIAKDLANLQGGNMLIHIDGDLFRVDIEFDILQ